MKISDFEVYEKLHYTKEHSWIKIEGKKCRVGVTDYFQKMLRGWAFRDYSELLFVALPELGAKISRSETIASIESMKAVSDLYAPISCEILEINEELLDSPNLIGESPYETGWIAIVKPFAFDEEINSLMNTENYCKYLQKLTEARKRELDKEYMEMLKKVGLKETFD